MKTRFLPLLALLISGSVAAETFVMRTANESIAPAPVVEEGGEENGVNGAENGNTAPVAVDDNNVVTASGSVIAPISANDYDNETAVAVDTIEIVDFPASGSVVVNGDGTVTYTHNGDSATHDTFTYTISDDDYWAISNVATVTITIVHGGASF